MAVLPSIATGQVIEIPVRRRQRDLDQAFANATLDTEVRKAQGDP